MGETMREQPSLTAFLPHEGILAEAPVIYMDSREASTSVGKKIAQRLNEFGADLRVKTLDFGDYLVGGDVAIERKTVFDFVGTLTKRFLFDQILNMRNVYPRSLVLLEGYMGVLRRFSRIRPESIYGSLFALAHCGVPVVPTIDHKDSALFIFTAAKQLQKESKPSVIRRGEKRKSLSDMQLYVVAGLPRVGHTQAVKLLSKFSTVRRVFSASKQELMEVDRIGTQIANTIVEVLDAPFKSEEESVNRELAEGSQAS
jgi:ERCC4-type nuclease